MSELENEVQEAVEDELTSLKVQATTLGITFHPRIGLAKLKEKIVAKMNDKPVVETAPISVTVVANAPREMHTIIKKETKQQFAARKRKESSQLIRINVVCMNPNKKDWEGDFFCVSNSVVGTHKKFVQFNTSEGWHVPRIILNHILERKCQIFVNAKGPRGEKTKKSKMIKEFNVEVLDNLTPDEATDLAQRQAMSGSIED